MLNSTTLNTLGKIAVGGLFILPITGYTGRYFMQEKIKESSHYGEVMECIKSQQQIKDLLGEPITEGRVDVGDSEACGRKNNVKWFTVPVHGPLASGDVKYWITTTDDTDYKIAKIRIEATNKAGETTVLLRDTSNTVMNNQK